MDGERYCHSSFFKHRTMISVYSAIVDTTPNTIRYSITTHLLEIFCDRFSVLRLRLAIETWSAPRRLAFSLQKLLKPKAAACCVAPRLGEQLPRDGERDAASRGWMWHDDDGDIRGSVHASRAKPRSGRAGRDLEGAKFHPRTFGRRNFANEDGEIGQRQRQLLERKVQKSDWRKLRRVHRPRPNRKSP